MIGPYFVLVPLAASFLITLIARKKALLAESLALLSAIALLSFSVIALIIVQNEGTILYSLSNWKLPYTISLVIDYLSSFMLLIISIISLVSIIYSMSYIKPPDKWHYYSLLLLMITGMNGVAITGDLFNLFVFMEIALIATYALVCFHGKAEHYEAAFKYAIMGSISSTAILFGIGCVYSLTSSLTLMQISSKVDNVAGLGLVYALFFTGFGLKSAVVPFHSWLPDAHPSAPSPVSAMLSGVLIKVLGVYALLRLFFNVFNTPELVLEILVILGVVSMLAGAFLAIPQKDIKRMLGFSSVSQMGYIVFAIGIGTPLALFGAVYHILNHAILKSLLFLNAGTIETIEGTRQMDEMKGIENRTVYTTTLMGALGISGVPPFGGFFSKLVIIIAAILSGKLLYALLALATSVLTMGYYLGMLKNVFKKGTDTEKIKTRIPKTMKLSLIILAVLSVAVSLLFIPVIQEAFLDKVVEAITSKTSYMSLFEAGEL